MNLFKRNKNKTNKNEQNMTQRLFMSIRFKRFRQGEQRLNNKKKIKRWLDTRMKNNGKPVMIQYLQPTIIDSPYISRDKRKDLNVQRNREGLVTTVSPTLAKLLVMSGEAKLLRV